MVAFFRKAIAFTKKYTILQRRKFFTGTDTDRDANAVPDIQWFGEDLGPPRWDDPEARVLCCLLDGSEEPSEAGSYFLFLVLNGEYRQREVMVPPLSHRGSGGGARSTRPPGGRRLRGRRCGTPAGSGGPISRQSKDDGGAAGEMNRTRPPRVTSGP